MQPPKVLVLMAAFNGSQWIVEQIDSILRQVKVDLDLIVSDDGSSDDTRSKLLKYGSDPRVQILCSEMRSGSAAQHFLSLIRNTSAAEHRFVALSDQDDIWDEQKLYRACTALIQSGAAGYSCAVTAFGIGGREKVLRQVASVTESDYLFEGAGQGCTFVITSGLYARVRTLLKQDPAAAELLHYHDWAIYALSRIWAMSWIFDRQSMMRYRQHGTNDTGARLGVAGMVKRVRLLRNGWYSRQLRAIADLCLSVGSDNAVVRRWSLILALPPGFRRRFEMARFCARGGRRRHFDNLVLICASLVGWL